MDKEKIKLVAIMGKSASGKDSILRKLPIVLSENEIPSNQIVSCTTRPMRTSEKEGVDYFFLTPEDFAEKVLKGKMLEAVVFRDWVYGTELDSLDKDLINIGIFTPDGIYGLKEDDRLDLCVIEINCSDKERMIRSFNREEFPDIEEIFRRFMADREDFADIEFSRLIVKNNDGQNLDSVVSQCCEVIKRHWPNMGKNE